MRFLIAFFVYFHTSLAIAFPEMFRHGYSSCTSCHVSPTGGGALNSYGRSVSGELLSTFANEKQARYYIPKIPNWLSWGGDIRYLNATSSSYNFSYHRHFLMESDFEIAISPVPGLTVSSTIGYYNVNFPEKNTRKIEAEQRRYYALLRLPFNFSLRAGRFFPSYGIHFGDHTLSTRRGLGFDNGRESLNTELAFENGLGNIFLTGVHGNQGSVLAGDRAGLSYERKSGVYGLAGKAKANVFKNSEIGVSFKRLVSREEKRVETAYGVFGGLSLFTSLYTLFELDQLIETGKKRDTIWVVRQGLEAVRGLHLSVTYEGIRSTYSAWRYGVQLFPISHLELSAEYQRKVPYPSGVKTENWILLAHWYL